jgi:DNA-binding HxlR family transcriptional regulator
MGEVAARRSAPAAKLTVPACACPTDGIIELVGKKWTLCLLATLSQQPTSRFNRLQEGLPGISPKTLSDTLQALVRHSVVARQAFAEVPPRVEYSLTESGWQLVESIRPLMAWAERHGGPTCCSEVMLQAA